MLKSCLVFQTSPRSPASFPLPFFGFIILFFLVTSRCDKHNRSAQSNSLCCYLQGQRWESCLLLCQVCVAPRWNCLCSRTTPQHVVTVYYFNLPGSFSGQMVYGVCWHLNRRWCIPFSNISIRVEPYVPQSFTQLLVPGAHDFVFTHQISLRVPESVLFTPKHSLPGLQHSKTHTAS